MAHTPSTTPRRPEGGHERIDKIKKKFGQTGPRQDSFERFRSQASARSSTGSERRVKADIILLERQLARSERRITAELTERFAALMPQRLREGGPALQQYDVRSIGGRVAVGDTGIRIAGATKSLEQAVGHVSTQHFPAPNIKWQWCTRQDSNL
jgi:hypothetical protein